MAQHDDHASGKPPASKPLASKSLHRTLQELESALADWDRADQPAPPVASQAAPPTATPVDNEMRERTKKLLAELRKQLTEFSD